MNKKILVKLVDIETGNTISCFYTTNWSEVFKMYSTILSMGDEAPMITTFKDDDNFQYNDKEMRVKDIFIQFGNNDALNVIEIFAEVF